MKADYLFIFDRPKLVNKIANISGTSGPIKTRISPLEREKLAAPKGVRYLILLSLLKGEI